MRVPGAAPLHERSYLAPLVSLTSLFFMWGLITSLNDILIPHLKAEFTLNYVEATLIQFAFFGAYFVMSMPSGWLVERIGYKRGIIVGLLVAAVGCVAFYPAAAVASYLLFLGALFVLASGITLLQVAANPYVTILGPARTASSRLTLTQAFNSLGTTIGPYVGARMILAAPASGPGAARRLRHGGRGRANAVSRARRGAVRHRRAVLRAASACGRRGESLARPRRRARAARATAISCSAS